ncbi:VOC family protein [Xylophilus sp.]|uniref:VOC family protein n=1 Tax=Xylophilus sp. TaxID=2653893 RepID=UPI002D7F1E08|nr:VOC family protein [Xylophilus sp.]
MLHHVELYVSNLTRSLEFWEPFLGGLGYCESQRWPQGVSYLYQKTYLCFVQAPEEHLRTGYHRKRVGLNHLAFHGRSRAHVDEVADWVKRSGFKILYPERFPYAGGPDHYALYCEDPDRIKVELVAPAQG